MTGTLPAPKFDRRYVKKRIPVPSPAVQRATYLEAVAAAAERWQVHPDFMRSRSTLGDSVWARAEVYYCLRSHNWSFELIAEYVNRDNSTIRHAITRYCDRHDIPMPVAKLYLPVSLASLAKHDRIRRIHTV